MGGRPAPGQEMRSRGQGARLGSSWRRDRHSGTSLVADLNHLHATWRHCTDLDLGPPGLWLDLVCHGIKADAPRVLAWLRRAPGHGSFAAVVAGQSSPRVPRPVTASGCLPAAPPGGVQRRFSPPWRQPVGQRPWTRRPGRALDGSASVPLPLAPLRPWDVIARSPCRVIVPGPARLVLRPLRRRERRAVQNPSVRPAPAGEVRSAQGVPGVRPEWKLDRQRIRSAPGRTARGLSRKAASVQRVRRRFPSRQLSQPLIDRRPASQTLGQRNVSWQRPPARAEALQPESDGSLRASPRRTRRATPGIAIACRGQIVSP